MHQHDAAVSFDVIFACIRPILTVLCPLFSSCTLIVPNVNRSLTTLDLDTNDIGVPDGWSTERDAMGEVKNYKHADGRTQRARPQGTSSGIVALAKALEVNRSLNTLNLRYNGLGDEGARHIAAALTHAE